MKHKSIRRKLSIHQRSDKIQISQVDELLEEKGVAVLFRSFRPYSNGEFRGSANRRPLIGHVKEFKIKILCKALAMFPSRQQTQARQTYCRTLANFANVHRFGLRSDMDSEKYIACRRIHEILKLLLSHSRV